MTFIKLQQLTRKCCSVMCKKLFDEYIAPVYAMCDEEDEFCAMFYAAYTDKVRNILYMVRTSGVCETAEEDTLRRQLEMAFVVTYAEELESYYYPKYYKDARRIVAEERHHGRRYAEEHKKLCRA